MSQIKIEVKGLKEFQNNLKQNPTITKLELNVAIRTSILIMLRYLKTTSIVPVRSGLLKQSIRSTFGNLRGTLAPHTNYAIYVHEGTKYQRSQPFLQTTVDDKIREVQHEFDAAAGRIVKKLAR